MKIRVVCWTLTCLTLAALAACGGGGGETNTTTAQPSSSIADTGSVTPAAVAPTPVQASSLTGSIVKGPVNGAQVCAYELTALGKGKQLGCATSNADGTYALTLEFEGEVVVEATGGTFTDEASGIANTPLSAPLQSVTTLAKGPNTLHATPLTALAFSRAVAAGGLSTAAFQAKANQVRDAFGLPTDVDLVRTLPTVAAGSINAYGTALHGVSKMLGMGATLAGMVGNDDLGALKSGFGQAAQCVSKPVAPVAPPVPNAVSTPGGIHWEDPTGVPGSVIFTVTQPTAAWRSLLPASGDEMGCQVSVNTSAQVVLTCPSAAVQPGVTLHTGLADSDVLTPPALPQSGILAMGHSIHVLGVVGISGSSTFNLNVVLPGTISAGGAVSLANQGGTISLSCDTNTLSESGILKGGGNVSIAGSTSALPASGSITLSGATVSTNWPTFSIPSESGGTLVFTGGNIAVQATGTQPSVNPVTLASPAAP